MRYKTALMVVSALALPSCADEATRKAYEGCIAQQPRGMSRRSAELFCDCLRKDSNPDMHRAHPAEECAERGARLSQT